MGTGSGVVVGIAADGGFDLVQDAQDGEAAHIAAGIAAAQPTPVLGAIEQALDARPQRRRVAMTGQAGVDAGGAIHAGSVRPSRRRKPARRKADHRIRMSGSPPLSAGNA